MKKKVHVLVQSKKEKFFMRMFTSCQSFEERVDVIHLMYDNKLDDLAWALISLISNKKLNIQSYVNSTPINWQYVSAGRAEIKIRSNKWTIRNLFSFGWEIKSKVQKAFRKAISGYTYNHLPA